MSTVKHITFTSAGYGHVKVSGIVNDKEVSFLTTETRMTDAAKDEDDKDHEEAMQNVSAILERGYENSLC